MSHVVGKTFQDRRGQLDLSNDRVAAPAKQTSHKPRPVVMVNNQLARYRVAEQTAAVLHRPHLFTRWRRSNMPQPQLLKEINPKANRQHQCSMCYGPIRAGEVYNRATLVYDGRAYDWLTCPACARDHIASRVWTWSYSDDGVCPELAHEWATERVIHGAADEQRAAQSYLARSEPKRLGSGGSVTAAAAALHEAIL